MVVYAAAIGNERSRDGLPSLPTWHSAAHMAI